MRLQVAIITDGIKEEEKTSLPRKEKKLKDNRKRGKRAKTRDERKLVRAVNRAEHDNYKEL